MNDASGCYVVRSGGENRPVLASSPVDAVRAWCAMRWPYGLNTVHVTAPDGSTEVFTVEENPLIGGWDVRKGE